MTTNEFFAALDPMDLMHAVVTYNADAFLVEDDETAYDVFVQMEDADELVDIICDQDDYDEMFVSAARLDLIGCDVKHIYAFNYFNGGPSGLVVLTEDFEELESYDIPCGWDVVGTPKWWLIDSRTGLDVNCYPKSDYSLEEAIEAEKEANR